MEFYERELLLSRILFGSTVIDINEDLTLYINPLTVKQNLLAQRVFKKAYDDALFSGVFTRKEMLALMENQGVWSEEMERGLKKTIKNIEDLKLDVYSNFLQPSKRESIRRDLRAKEREQLKFFEQRHQNAHLDCEGIATYSRMIWIIENTTTYENGDPYLFDEVSITSVLKRKGDSGIETSEYREIARTNPWKTIWNNAGQDPEKVFQKPIFELTVAQSELTGWARLYDNVAESYEAPTDKIIEDDDALDGWLIKQSREREKEKNQYKQDGISDRHANADEVFVVTQSREEAKEVYDLNDPEGQFAVESRKAAIEKADKKGRRGIRYHKFRDVKIKALNEASNYGK